jgi:hypothetical protein
MATLYRPIGRFYARPVGLDHGYPLRAAELREIGESCNWLLSQGRWHGAASLANMPAVDSPIPDVSDHQWVIKITPQSSTLRIAVLLQDGALAGSIQFHEPGTFISASLTQGTSTNGELRGVREVFYSLDVTARVGSEIEIYACEGYPNLIKALLFEDWPVDGLTAAAGAHDTRLHRRGKGVSAADVAALAVLQRTAIGVARREVIQCGSICSDKFALVASVSDWANAIDPTGYPTGTWDVDAPGWWWAPSTPWTSAAGEMRLTLNVLASIDAGSGDGKIRFATDWATSDTITVTATTPTWHSATLSATGPADLCADWEELVQPQAYTVGGTGTVNIHSVSAVEQDYRP